MAYTIVPVDANEAFSVSQPKITDNFAAINTVISIDHETFDAVNQGKHKWVKFTEQSDQATLSDEMLLYTKDNAGEPNLYLRKESSGTIFNMTPSTSGHGVANAASGSETLPSGLKLIWGTGTASGAGSVITFADGGFPSYCFNVTATLFGMAGSYYFINIIAGSVSNTQFIIACHDRDALPVGQTVFYQAIGK